MNAPAAPDPERLHILAALLRAWVLALAAWLAEFEGVLPRMWRRELLALVRAAEIDTRRLVFVVAVAGMGPPPPEMRGAMRPRSCPPGFRRVRHQGADTRMMQRGVRMHRRGGIAARIARVRAVLARLGMHVAAMRRRIAQPGVSPRLTPVAPPAQPPAALCAPVCACVDSS